MRLEVDVRRDLAAGRLPPVQPFHAMAYPFPADLALAISKQYAAYCALTAARLSVPPLVHPPRTPLAPGRSIGVFGGCVLCSAPHCTSQLVVQKPTGQRLRVAYVSSDFGNHPLSHLMGSVFALHNRTRVEVFCYALSPNDRSEWRQRIERDAEHFLDVSAWSVGDIAARMSADGIHVAINLNGYTKGARNEIFALKPAPVQASYMGFPATTGMGHCVEMRVRVYSSNVFAQPAIHECLHTQQPFPTTTHCNSFPPLGAPFLPYLIIDKVVAPPECRHCYSENLAYMPNCYFVNDYKRAHRDVLDERNLPSRTSVGLPEDKIIYSCSNQLYKYDPETFKTWCNVLKRVPNSVLWLLRFPPYGEPRIRQEAVAMGIASERIIFTDVANKPEHIRRSGLADVFLDTPLCNAHTTGMDHLVGVLLQERCLNNNPGVHFCCTPLHHTPP